MATPSARTPDKEAPQELQSVVIRFAGDSGDGMQLTGTQFTNTTAVVGNDLATLPDYPAEIRAPAGTVAGVSGFQIAFGSDKVFTPGDELDVLVAMNPAALKRNIGDVKPRGTVIVNTGAFTAKNLKTAGYEENPLEDQSLSGYRIVALDISRLTAEALKETGLSARDVERSKNFYTLGLLYWMYNRPLEPTLEWIEKKFRGKDKLVEANSLALKGGHVYGESAEVFQTRYEVRARSGVSPGEYSNVTGNRATALGLAAAGYRANLPVFLGSYPITPASEILHDLASFKNHGVVTFQAEDEIAAITSAIGAAFGGSLALTTTSGPGMALKTEAMGLAVIAELPLVIVNVQRGGPSTGLPTKTEQADLLQALYGRNGEAPIPVVAAKSPGDCFTQAVEAARIAVKYRTPVILLTDGYIANGAEPWRIPDADELPVIEPDFRTEAEGFLPYGRDEKTLARPWVRPGTPGLEHRIGGLEKDETGMVSYVPEVHEKMVHLRAEKVERIADDIPDAEFVGSEDDDLLVVSWGGTYGTVTKAVEQARTKKGLKVAHMHLSHINPMPKNVGRLVKKFPKVLVPEINAGQLSRVLRERFLVDVKGYNRILGLPLKTNEVVAAIEEMVG